MSSNSSFINGIIVGAGIVMALMSTGFLYYIAPIENQQGISSTEIRVAIFLGGIVAAVAIAYEFYSKKNETPKSQATSESDGIIHDHTEPEPPENTKSDTEPEPPEQKSDDLSDESKPDMEPQPEYTKSDTEPEPPENKSDEPQESQAKDKKES